MKLRKRMFVLIGLIVSAMIFSACGSKTSQPAAQSGTSAPQDKASKFTIGVSMPTFNDKWLSYLLGSMKDFGDAHKDFNATYVDAQNDANKQLSQVETFISQKVSAIAIVPVDTVSIQQIVDKANKAKIPIVIINRTFDGVDKASAYVGGQSIESGILEMTQVGKVLGGKGDIAVMEGSNGHEAAIQRTAGYKQVIKEKYPDIKIVLDQSADFDRAKGMSLMENWLNSGKHIDAVAANNDEMAIGAIMALKAANKLDQIKVFGIDGTPVGLGFIKSGELQATVFQDAMGQGKGGMETAYKLAKGEQVNKTNYVPYVLVTKDNVDEIQKKWDTARVSDGDK
ncbi:sugar ABC transporter substrate-binding protein [Paenibacillus sp. GCM10027628]|uniref:sugar ABC transporter substrate-binding protein n=1 Tax=Paenibacillus sp. GCM10027628 TaxID=3273413 RepID=UPI00362730F0